MAIRFNQVKMEGNQTHVVISDSVNELANEVLQATKSHPDPHTGIGTTKFVGRKFSTIKEAVAAVKEPWDKGIKAVSEMLIELRKTVKLPKPVSLKRQKVWSDEDGDEIDFDRLRTGEPFYRTTKRAPAVKTKQLTLLVDVAANCSTSHDDLYWRGVAAIAIAKLLESAGYRVEIWTIQAAYRGMESGDSFASMCKVKGMKDRLNIGMVATTVSSWFFRTVGFHAYNLIKGDSPRSGLGQHCDDFGPALDMIEPNEDSRLVIKDVWDKETAAELVKDVIERMNSEAESQLASA